MSGFARHLMLGSAWMIGARWAMRLIGLASTVILARLLVPADFGVIAMAMIAVGLLETIAYAGVDLALMRDGAGSREHYDTAWTIQCIQGVFVGLLLVAVAPLAAAYFSEPRATAVIQVMALRSLISGLQNIGVVAFRKELDFAKEFRFTLYSKLLNFLILVGAAFWFRNYWAMVLALVTGAAITVGLSYSMHPYRPRLSLARASAIWSFSQWLMIARIGSFLSGRSDSFVVGGSLGTSAMGSYHVASELSSLPTSELVMPVRRALYPTLATLEGRPGEFSSAVLSSFSAIAAVCFAVGFGLMSTAPEVVCLFLGQSWLEAIPLIRLLAVHGCISALILVLEVPLWVQGKTRLSALPTWLELALLVPALLALTGAFGVVGAAMARTAVAVVVLPVMVFLIVRQGWVTGRQLAAELWRPCLAGSVMALVVTNLGLHDLPLPLILVCKVLAGGVIYSSCMALLWVCAGRPEGFEIIAWRRLRAAVLALRSRQLGSIRNPPP